MNNKEKQIEDTKSLNNAYMSLAKYYEERKENAIRQVKDGAFVDLLNQEIEELQKAKAIVDMQNVVCKKLCNQDCRECNYYNKNDCIQKGNVDALYNAGYRKIDKDSVVLSREELKRLETNYKIGLGKSQSWCKSLKNRIEELEKQNFKLKVELEDAEEYNAKANEYLDKYRKELVNASKETAEKFAILLKAKMPCEEVFKGVWHRIDETAKQFGVEIKED